MNIACSTLVPVRSLMVSWYRSAVDHDPTDLARSRTGRGLWLVFAALLLVAAAVVTGLNLMRYFTVEEVRLPDLVGLPQEQAALLVRREGLEPVSFGEYVADAAPGAVTSQTPVAGAVVKQGRTVHLGVNTASVEARVPDMLGMREEDARARAQELNLPLGTVVYRSGEQAVGTVVEQNPAGGSRLTAGQTVELIVSRGRERAVVTLPDLVGADVDEAMTRLAGLGFTRVESVAAAVSFSAPRTVVAMSPAQGATVVQSTPVLLHYALSTSNVVTVPEILGFPQWRAQLALRAAQLDIGVISYIQDPTQPAGVVAVQPTGYTLPGTPVLMTINGEPPATPFPGFDAPIGGQVPADPGGLRSPVAGGGGIDVTDTPANDGSRTVPFTFDPTFMGVRRLLEEPYNLRLVITDDLGERTVLDEQLDPGEIATTTVNVYGSEAMLQTFIDGVFFQAWRP
jgi:beta-lactam-binding protein with PASTA domain